MNQRLALSSAFASALALGLIGHAAAQDAMGKDKMSKDAGKEKCFGIAKAGQNDCANLSGSHSCAGQSKAEMGADEWKYVAKGTCKEMKGMTQAEVKDKMSMMKK
jgi:uncharacterized membrane protein